MSPRHENEHFSIDFGRLCIVCARGIMPHHRACHLLPCRRPQSFRRAPTTSWALWRPPPLPARRAPRAGLAALRAPTRDYGRQVVHNLVQSVPRPARVPACGRTSPHYLRRRLIRPSTTESNPATANRAAARFFCFDGVKSAISRGHLVPFEPNVARWNRLAQKERVRRVSARARLSFVWKSGGFCGGRPNGDFWRSAAGAEGS